MRWTAFDWVDLLALLVLVGSEIVALTTKTPGEEGQTISHKIVRWIKKSPKVRRTAIFIGLAWFAYHLLWQPF